MNDKILTKIDKATRDAVAYGAREMTSWLLTHIVYSTTDAATYDTTHVAISELTNER